MTDTARLIPHADLGDMLAVVMKDRGYLSQEPFIRHGEAGWQPARPLPPDEGLRLSDFLAVISDLPDPAPEAEAAEAIVQVVRDRGYLFLRGDLEQEWASRWPDPAEAVPDAIPGSALRCAHCGKPIPPERGPRARFCKNSHRVAAAKKRKRANG